MLLRTSLFLYFYKLTTFIVLWIKIWKRRDWSGKTQSPLPEIVPSGALKSSSVPVGTGGTDRPKSPTAACQCQRMDFMRTVIYNNNIQINNNGWLGSRVVSVLDWGTEGPGFKSQSRRCRVTVLGKLFTPIVPLFTKQQNREQPY